MTDGLILRNDDSNVRKERVHTTMLIELLVTLVFLAMAYAFVQKDETSMSTMKDQLEQARAELEKADAKIAQIEKDNAELRDENKELQDSVARLAKAQGHTLAANEQPVVIPMSEYRRLKDQAANDTAMLNESQKENAELRSRLTGPKAGGVDRPNCPVTAGFLLRIDLMASGDFVVAPTWTPGATDAALRVPGVSELVAAGHMAPATFEKWSERIAEWGKAQPVECGFRVSVYEHHSDLDLYKRQLSVIEQYFYDKRY